MPVALSLSRGTRSLPFSSTATWVISSVSTAFSLFVFARALSAVATITPYAHSAARPTLPPRLLCLLPRSREPSVLRNEGQRDSVAMASPSPLACTAPHHSPTLSSPPLPSPRARRRLDSSRTIAVAFSPLSGAAAIL
ncbi:hypothetical protein BV20DRAFT_967909 [Pilatotrama ljubarskyi]|nr:hypothetical protein BV20DRAFT_967909 [Pilatotrama ljubarskyi]